MNEEIQLDFDLEELKALEGIGRAASVLGPGDSDSGFSPAEQRRRTLRHSLHEVPRGPNVGWFWNREPSSARATREHLPTLQAAINELPPHDRASFRTALNLFASLSQKYIEPSKRGKRPIDAIAQVGRIDDLPAPSAHLLELTRVLDTAAKRVGQYNTGQLIDAINHRLKNLSPAQREEFVRDYGMLATSADALSSYVGAPAGPTAEYPLRNRLLKLAFDELTEGDSLKKETTSPKREAD